MKTGKRALGYYEYNYKSNLLTNYSKDKQSLLVNTKEKFYLMYKILNKLASKSIDLNIQYFIKICVQI